MIKLKKKEKVILVITVSVAFILIMERILLGGLRDKLKELRQQIKIEEKKLRRNLAIQESKDKILADSKNYQPYLKAAQADEKQIVAELLKETERIAKESMVSVINLSPQNTQEQTKEYKKYKADLRIEANLQQVFNFLYKIQESKLLIKLDKLSLKPKDEQASLLRAELVVSITTLP